MSVLKVHSLLAEGAAFEWVDGQPSRVRWNSVSGTGVGVCSCGATSMIVDSAAKRKEWHRLHKAWHSGQDR